MSSHGVEFVAILSHCSLWHSVMSPRPTGARLAVGTSCNVLSVPADSPLNPKALNFTQIGKSHTKWRQNDPNDNEGLAYFFFSLIQIGNKTV